MRDEELLNGWMPYHLVQDAKGNVSFRWIYVGDHPFAEPFFEESISKCMSLPQNRQAKFPVTSSETMLRIADQAHCIAPTAFIYHISRCGSTLLAQLLACDEKNIVLSEVPLLDAVLRLPAAPNGTSIEELFKAALKLLSRKRSGNEARVFVKADSWHVLFYERLHAWYPGLPSFLMYRSPKEVGESQANAPAMHSVPGVLEPALFGLFPESAVNMTRDEYLDHVLACYFNAYLDILRTDEQAVVLNYHHGTKQMMSKIFEVCGFVTDEAVLAEMEKRSGFHSKNPKQDFSGDVRAIKPRGNFMRSQKMFDALEQMMANEELNAHDAR